MGNALAGGSGWVLLVYVPRDGRLINQYASDHSQTLAGGIPILALDMYEHAYHIDFGANAAAYVDAFMRNIDWNAVQGRYEDAIKVAPPQAARAEGVRRPARLSASRRSRRCSTRATPVQIVDARPRHYVRAESGHHGRRGLARPGTPAMNGWASCRSPSRWSFSAPTAFTSDASPQRRCARPGFDARYMAGGHSAWKAIKGPVKLHDVPNGLEAA